MNDGIIAVDKFTKSNFKNLIPIYNELEGKDLPDEELLPHVDLVLVHDGEFVAYSRVLKGFKDNQGVEHDRIDTLISIRGYGYGGKLLKHIIENSTGMVRLRASDKSPWLINYYSIYGFMKYGHGFPNNELELKR